jgi:putative peptidoglycan lipid II flippase
MFLLRHSLNRQIGPTGLPAGYVALLWISAGFAAALAWGVKLSMPALHPVLKAIAILGVYGFVFFGAALLFRVPEAHRLAARITR